ncbi:type II toxin-antitoxin system death-on-curing family toxin [Mobiluncus mulieris]|uniref:type II toxin-antitoxin system death-on-curing family toxin n=1 Tax=Mobiluncus mulieris TaxID=2052 RepID=UPI00243094C4|nr:type II toxin-antitoxin system death-on-curing family toxin [Mobiluncus mulieris]
MKYLSKSQIRKLHADLIASSGGLSGLRDEGLLESAIATPLQGFSGADLYPTIIDKATQLAFGLIRNHPFIDGNKRIGTHAMLVLLYLNEIELAYEDDELIQIILNVAAGQTSRDDLYQWIKTHITE